MAFNFDVSVPSSKGGGSSGGGADETNRLLKKLDKSIIATFDPLEILTQAFSDLIKLFNPLIKIVSLLLFIVLLPLLPLIKLLVTGIGKFIKSFDLDRVKEVGEAIKELTSFIFITLPKLAWDLIMNPIKTLGEALTWLWEHALVPLGEGIAGFASNIWNDYIVPGFEILLEIGITIWNWLVQGLQPVLEFGKMIWDFFLQGLEFISDIGERIWNLFKSGLSFIANLGQMIWDVIKSSLSALFGGGGSRSGTSSSATDGVIQNGRIVGIDPADTIIATRNPGSLGGGATVNINNPTFRNENDMNNMANKVSQILQRQMKGRISSG